jgi:hypothetical protein
MNRLVTLAIALTACACACACSGATTTDTPAAASERSAPEARAIDEAAPDDAIDASAPAADAGSTCPPASIDYALRSWLPAKPPRVVPTACAAGQTLAIMTPCELGVGACGDFDPSLGPCLYCLYGRETDATYGLRTHVAAADAGAGADRLNVRGYALLAGAATECAEALEDYEGCVELACACANRARRTTCIAKARSGACGARRQAVDSACAAGDSAAASAIARPVIEAGHFTTESGAVTMAQAFCGGS